MNENDKKELFDAISKKVAEEVKNTVNEAVKKSVDESVKKSVGDATGTKGSTSKQPAKNNSKSNFKSLEKKVKSGNDTLAERIEYEKQKVARAVETAGKKLADSTINKIPKELKAVGNELKTMGKGAASTVGSVTKQTGRLGMNVARGTIGIGMDVGKGAIDVGKQLTNNKLSQDAYKALMYTNPITALLYENSDLIKSGFNAAKSTVGLAYNTTRAVGSLAMNTASAVGGIGSTIGHGLGNLGKGLGNLAFAGASAIYNNRSKLFGKKDDASGTFQPPALFNGGDDDNNSGKFLLEDKSGNNKKLPGPSGIAGLLPGPKGDDQSGAGGIAGLLPGPKNEDKKGTTVAGLLSDIKKNEKESKTLLLEDKQDKKKDKKETLKEAQERKNLMSPIFGMRKELDGIHKETKEGNELLKKNIKQNLLIVAAIAAAALAIKNWDKVWPVLQKGINTTATIVKNTFDLCKRIFNIIHGDGEPGSPTQRSTDALRSFTSANQSAEMSNDEIGTILTESKGNVSSVGKPTDTSYGDLFQKYKIDTSIQGNLSEIKTTWNGDEQQYHMDLTRTNGTGRVNFKLPFEVSIKRQIAGIDDKNHVSIVLERHAKTFNPFVIITRVVQVLAPTGQIIPKNTPIAILDSGWAILGDWKRFTEVANLDYAKYMSNTKSDVANYKKYRTTEVQDLQKKQVEKTGNQLDYFRKLDKAGDATGALIDGLGNITKDNSGEDNSQDQQDNVSGNPSVSYNINKNTQPGGDSEETNSLVATTSNIGINTNTNGQQVAMTNNGGTYNTQTPLEISNKAQSSQIMGLYDAKDIAMASCDILQPVALG